MPIGLFRGVAGGYLEAMGMRLLRGRGIDRGDVERSAPILVVNKAFADAVQKAKPPGAKGHFINRVAISSTMGPGVKVERRRCSWPLAASSASFSGERPRRICPGRLQRPGQCFLAPVAAVAAIAA